jgi:hypothetical protein
MPDWVHFDCLSYETGFGAALVLENTEPYLGQDPSDPTTFQYTVDLPYFAAATLAEYEAVKGEPTIAAGNFVSGRYICGDARPLTQSAASMYVENFWLECWIVTNGPTAPATTQSRSATLDCPYAYWMEEQDKGLIFTAHDPEGSERGKRFSLAMFYMINHPNAFYYYRTRGHYIDPGELIEDYFWNPWVEYDVGQPAGNSFGLQDFEGQTGTTKYFVYETGAEYEVLGRCYLRDGSQHILVLVKLMAWGCQEGEDPVSITLPGSYKPVLDSSGTLGPATDSITLSNNDGVILVKNTSGGKGGIDPPGE